MQLIPIKPDGSLVGGTEILTDEARDAIEATIGLYNNVGHAPPWIGYLVVVEGEWVGACAFKSTPQDKAVEIAYYTFPQHEDLGYATAMAQALITMAHATDPTLMILAQTLAEEGPSPHILRKLGFELAEEFEDPDDGLLWEWRLAPLSS
ncbi:MAG TPA: GNAT family N-acetyltransferase [Burkholderiales bacterium]|nr:GNAT family N-acetyltransferase [Burkholderiales bacterium]